jgi:hypothetical protein
MAASVPSSTTHATELIFRAVTIQESYFLFTEAVNWSGPEVCCWEPAGVGNPNCRPLRTLYSEQSSMILEYKFTLNFQETILLCH